LQYSVLSNDCPFGPSVGQLVTVDMRFDEAAPDDGYVSQGEEVDVSDSGYQIGRMQFAYPTFTVQEPVTQNDYSGTAYLAITFEAADSGHGSRTETYADDSGDSCTVAAAN
jgi:hypothetical protein